MASHRDEAFEAFYDKLAVPDDADPRILLRTVWEAGRCYEVERVDALARHRMRLTSREDDRGEGAM